MKVIKKLEDMIHEELEGAEHYAKCALKYKEEYRDLADTLYDISQQEMKHVSALHEHVVKLIERHKEEHGEPPQDMLAVYNYLHDKEIEQAKEIKMLQQMYR